MVKVVCYSSPSDSEYCNKLLAHLSNFRRQGNEVLIFTGSSVFDGIPQIQKCDIVALMVTPEFLNSDYYEEIMPQIIRMKKKEKSIIVPIIIQPCDWQDDYLRNFVPIPSHGKPVENWENIDSAFLEIAKSIKQISLRYSASHKPVSNIKPQVHHDDLLPESYLNFIASRLLREPSLTSQSVRDGIWVALNPRSDTVIRENDDNLHRDMVCILDAALNKLNAAHVLKERLRHHFAPNSLTGREILNILDWIPEVITIKSLLQNQYVDGNAIRSSYVSTIRYMQRVQEVFSVDDALLSLLSAQYEDRRYLCPLHEFVLRVHSQCPTDELAEWLNGNVDPIQLSETKQKISYEVKIDYYYLLVDVPCKSDASDAIEFWLYDEHNRVIKKWSEQVNAQNSDINNILGNVIEFSASMYPDLVVELFLSDHMLDLDPDHWKLMLNGQSWSLGELYPVHLRWRNRARGDRGTNSARWKALHDKSRSQLRTVRTWWISQNHPPPQLIHDLRSGKSKDIIGFLFVPFSNYINAPHKLLAASLIGGMAFGVWSRIERPAWNEFADAIDQSLRHATTDDVSIRITKSRASHEISDVTVFWDDPQRNPLGDKLEEPRQRSRQ